MLRIYTLNCSRNIKTLSQCEKLWNDDHKVVCNIYCGKKRELSESKRKLNKLFFSQFFLIMFKDMKFRLIGTGGKTIMTRKSVNQSTSFSGNLQYFFNEMWVNVLLPIWEKFHVQVITNTANN